MSITLPVCSLHGARASAPHGDHVRVPELTNLHMFVFVRARMRVCVCVYMRARACTCPCVYACAHACTPNAPTSQVCTFDNRGVGQSEFCFLCKPKHNLNPTYTFAGNRPWSFSAGLSRISLILNSPFFDRWAATVLQCGRAYAYAYAYARSDSAPVRAYIPTREHIRMREHENTF
jgi:hypothetical protein